jgi:hypothetical protein
MQRLKIKLVNLLIGKELKKLLRANLSELKESLETTGGCDHSVGMCVCVLKDAIHDTQEMLDRLNGAPICKHCGHARPLSEYTTDSVCVYCENKI